jgi:hypothetical protein
MSEVMAAYQDVLDQLITVLIDVRRGRTEEQVAAALKEELQANADLTRPKALGLLAVAVARLARAEEEK